MTNFAGPREFQEPKQSAVAPSSFCSRRLGSRLSFKALSEEPDSPSLTERAVREINARILYSSTISQLARIPKSVICHNAADQHSRDGLLRLEGGTNVSDRCEAITTLG